MSDHNIQFLGQKFSFPNTWPACLAVFAISISAVLFSYTFLVLTPKGRLTEIGNVFQSGFTNTEGQLDLGDSYSLGFWTPSNKTTEFWQSWTLDNPDEEIGDDNLWEADLNNDQKATEFGTILTCELCPATGYRRYEVIGKGRSLEKPGYWWVVTMNKDYSVESFVREYSHHWGSTNSIFIEITRDINANYE